MVLEPIYESVFHPFSWDFDHCDLLITPSVHYAEDLQTPRGLSGSSRDIAACFDEIDHRRCFLKKRIQDPQILDLVTRMLRCGIWEQGQISYPPIGTAQGSVVSPLLANVFLHEFDDWYVRIVYVQNGSTLLFITAISAQEGNWRHSMLTRYADDWVAVWNGSRDRAESRNQSLPG